MFRTAFGVSGYSLLVPLATLVLGAIWIPRGWLLIVHQGLALVLAGLMAYLMLTTNYRVVGGSLDLRSGPFRRRIPIDSITALSEYGIKRGRVYGLGTDIVAVKHEGGEVGITPKDPVGLAEALGIRLTRLGDGQAPA